MKAVFVRADDPETSVGSAAWSKDGARVEADNDEIREKLERVFHESPIVIDDPSLRSFGTGGPVVLQPGTLRWFRAAARERGAGEGLGVRFVADEPVGWDPAGAYRPFTAVDDDRR
jgi:hypothetical protein